MVLRYFETEIEKVLEKSDSLSFDELIRNCRECMGLMQCKAAEFIGIVPNRLKILEKGQFSSLPSEKELAGLAKLYDIKISFLEQKALEHVSKRRNKKSRTSLSKNVHALRNSKN